METGRLDQAVRHRSPAVDGIDLEVAEGEIYGFLGPNGAGKSTFIRVLCTLLHPSSGRPRWPGYDVVGDPQEVRLRIGVALQDAALDDRQTGRELLTLQGRLYGLQVRTRSGPRLEQVLDLVDIGSSIDRRIGHVLGRDEAAARPGGGSRPQPRDPFPRRADHGSRPGEPREVWAEVRRLNAELGMTIFLTTQYLEEADELADRVGFIREGPDRRRGHAGRVEEIGRPGPDRRRAADRRVRRGSSGDLDAAVRSLIEVLGCVECVSVEDGESGALDLRWPGVISPVAVALGKAHLEVTSLTLRTPTLDDVFRELTGSGSSRARR